MGSSLHLQDNAVTFSVSGLPMVGNLDTGGLIGLTKEGAAFCDKLAAEGMDSRQVPDGCRKLLDHLDRGGYLSTNSSQPAQEHMLQSAYLHVTQRCNLTCRFCYSADAARNVLPDPPLDNLLRAIELLAGMGCRRLVVSGGEPFLRNDLGEIAAHAKSCGMQSVAVLTNGTYVTPERLNPLCGTVDSIAVAFDGCSQDAPAHLRGQQRYDCLVQAVRHITSCGIEPVILPTIHAKNLDDIPAYRGLGAKLGAKVQFSLLAAPSDELGDFALSTGQMHRLAQLSACEGAAVQDSALNGSIGVRRWCGAGARTLSVAADGTVYPCHMLHRQDLAMGNAFTDKAGRIRRSEIAHRFEALNVDVFAGCSECEARYLCGGGCRARALLDGGSLMGRDACCELQKVYFAVLFDKLISNHSNQGGSSCSSKERKRYATASKLVESASVYSHDGQ